MDFSCINCGEVFRRYDRIQTRCRDCTIIKLQGKAPKPRAPLKRSQKPINQRGKVKIKDDDFRDKILRPYLIKHFGIACAECGALPPMLDSGQYSLHAVDHIQGKGPHPELRFVITNFQFLCLPCHENKTGVPQWTPKAAA